MLTDDIKLAVSIGLGKVLNAYELGWVSHSLKTWKFFIVGLGWFANHNDHMGSLSSLEIYPHGVSVRLSLP